MLIWAILYFVLGLAWVLITVFNIMEAAACGGLAYLRLGLSSLFAVGYLSLVLQPEMAESVMLFLLVGGAWYTRIDDAA